MLCSTSALFWAPEMGGLGQAILILAPLLWRSLRTREFRRTSALFGDPEKARMRHPILISPSFVGVFWRMQVLRCTSTLFGVPKKGEVANTDFVPLCLGIPEDARVT